MSDPLEKNGAHQQGPRSYYNYLVKKLLLFSFLVIFLFTNTYGCTLRNNLPTHDSKWNVNNLILLESPNSPDPRFDLIAAYARQTRTDVEIRFDLLGSPAPADYDFYLIIGNDQQGSTWLPVHAETGLHWDLLLQLPGQGMPNSIQADSRPSGIRPRSIRSSIQDSITIRLNKDAIHGQWNTTQAQAFITESGSQEVIDSIGPMQLNLPAQIDPAPLALVFWNSLPSATPAQLLRRWNGAHTGPLGQRHGLSILLQAASKYKVPIAILDLTRPEYLAGIDSVGGLQLIQDMQRNDLLLLTDTAFGHLNAGEKRIQYSQRAGKIYKLRQNEFLFGSAVVDQYSLYQAAFARQNDVYHVINHNGTQIIPLPDADDSLGPDGLTVQTRQKLLEIALSDKHDDLIILGGEIPSSTWADYLTVGPVMEYLANHPWIQLMNGKDLLGFPARQGTPDCEDLLCYYEETAERSFPMTGILLDSLKKSPDNLFTELGWITYLQLTNPTLDFDLMQLRNGYLGQINALISAALWSEHPDNITSCVQDLDWDNHPECILATKHYFFIIDPQGARLIFGAATTRNGPIQIIGPRSQQAVGLGDRFKWQLNSGSTGDPDDISGGFIDSSNAWKEYHSEQSPGQIIFIQPETQLRKSYTLGEQGLKIEIISNQPVSTKLPILLLDQNGYLPGWYSRYLISANQQDLVSAEIIGVSEVWIKAENAELKPVSFTQSLDLIKLPEDPDFGYPPGHYIPFPMTIIEIQSEGSFSVVIGTH